MRWAKILAMQVAIGALLLEALLRAFNPLPSVVRGDQISLPVGLQYRRQNAPDPRLDPITIYTRNSLGFRGPEPPADLRSRVSIIAVGGSTTEDGMLTDGKSWPEVMGTMLAASHPDTWVNNAGFRGHSTTGHLVLLRSVLVTLKPSIMLVLAGVNDIGLANNAGSNEFDRHGDNRLLNGVARHSEVASTFLNLVRVWRASRMVFAGSELVNFSALAQTDLTDQQIAARIAPYTTNLADYDARLIALAAEARHAGIVPIFLTQPALVGEAIDPATGLDLRRLVMTDDDGLNGLAEWRLLETYNDVMRRNAAAHGVALIDLARQLPKDSRNYCDFIHFSNDGARAVATIVAAGLEPYLTRHAGS